MLFAGRPCFDLDRSNRSLNSSIQGTGDQSHPMTTARKTRNQRQAVTVNDIAHACGVSRATVSLVLRGSPLVHADTRARVEAELKRQGYVYHRAAANLRARVVGVALVINDLSNPFFAEFAAGVDEALGGEATSRCSAAPANRPSASGRCWPRCWNTVRPASSCRRPKAATVQRASPGRRAAGAGIQPANRAAATGISSRSTTTPARAWRPNI